MFQNWELLPSLNFSMVEKAVCEYGDALRASRTVKPIHLKLQERPVICHCKLHILLQKVKMKRRLLSFNFLHRSYIIAQSTSYRQLLHSWYQVEGANRSILSYLSMTNMVMSTIKMEAVICSMDRYCAQSVHICAQTPYTTPWRSGREAKKITPSPTSSMLCNVAQRRHALDAVPQIGAIPKIRHLTPACYLLGTQCRSSSYN